MSEQDEDLGKRQQSLFDDVGVVVCDDVRFKLKLGIGSDAYLSMKVGKQLQKVWDVGGVAATGAGAAASPAVAGAFFSSGGFLSTLGLGAAATTPIGWVVGAAVVSGAAYYGVTRLFSKYSGDRVETIPKFINTPIDVLGAKLFDLIVPLALKVARIDGDYDPRERTAIVKYFENDWGYDPRFVEAALTVIEENTTDQRLNDLVTALAKFKSANPDCNYQHMCESLIEFLREIAEADHKFDEREEMAIERIQKVLMAKGRLSFSDLTSNLPSISRSSQS